MTQILAIVTRNCVVQASDRLTVKFQKSKFLGDHDACANKSVIYVCRDGYMVVSFAGIAYVGDVPTDEWLAQILIGRVVGRRDEGRPAMLSFGKTLAKQINQALWLLQRSIDTEKSLSGGIEILVSGWRIRRRHLVPFSVGIARSKNETKRFGDMRLPKTINGRKLASAGQLADLRIIDQNLSTRSKGSSLEDHSKKIQNFWPTKLKTQAVQMRL